MKKRYLILGIALLLTAGVVFGMGIYLKYGVLKPLGLAQGENAMALPFLMLTDEGLRYAVEEAQRPEPSLPTQTTPPTTVEVELSATQETNPPTTEETTVPPTTQCSTTLTTEPPTVPSTTPPPTTPVVRDENTPPEFPDWASMGVEESWYDDVLFIGDSRTTGLRDLYRSGNADYFCKVGMSVFSVLEERESDLNFAKQKLEELLKSKTYGKIFINLGLNECGYPISSLIGAYGELIALIRELQPEAKMILQAIMTVSRGKAASESCFAISNLQAINERLAALADGQTVFYVDVNTVFADSEGYLPGYMSSDGCHLYGKYYALWADWLGYAAKELGI